MISPARVFQVDDILASVVSFLLGLVGIAFIVMLIFSGYSYISAGGNKESLARAQHSFMNSFLGLMITLAAWVIVSMAGRFLGLNLSSFTICITPGCV
jgi:uncharacterized membrane protein